MNIKPSLIGSAIASVLMATPLVHAAGSGCSGAAPRVAAPAPVARPRPMLAAPAPVPAPWRGGYYRPWRGWRAPWSRGPWGGAPWGNGWRPWGNHWGNNDWGDMMDTMTGLVDGSTEVNVDVDFKARGLTNMMSDFWGNGWNGWGYRRGYYPYPPLPPVAPRVAPAAAPAATAKVEVAPPSLDSDGDGVADPFDLCADTPAASQVDAFGCPQGATIVLRGVNFHTDSDKLTDESTAILDRVARTLSAHPEIKVEVAGHTDSDGDAAYNKDLSQRRANAVMAYLASKGVKAGNMRAKGYGEEQPITSNDTPEGKAMNRRVELVRVDG